MLLNFISNYNLPIVATRASKEMLCLSDSESDLGSYLDEKIEDLDSKLVA